MKVTVTYDDIKTFHHQKQYIKTGYHQKLFNFSDSDFQSFLKIRKNSNEIGKIEKSSKQN